MEGRGVSKWSVEAISLPNEHRIQGVKDSNIHTMSAEGLSDDNLPAEPVKKRVNLRDLNECYLVKITDKKFVRGVGV